MADDQDRVVQSGEPVQTLPAFYQYGGSPPPGHPMADHPFPRADVTSVPLSVAESDEAALEDMPEATIEEWLGEGRPQVQEWIPLPNLGRKILIKAMDEPTRKEIRAQAPTKMSRGPGRQMRRVKDADWIQLEMLRRHILVPDFSQMDVPEAHRVLSKALSGEVYTITVKINELSGFDMDSMTGNAGDELE